MNTVSTPYRKSDFMPTVKHLVSLLLTVHFFAFSLSAQETIAGNQKTTLNVAQPTWCPQICPGNENPGVISEIVAEVFRDSDFNVVFSTFPWPRAISHVNNGQSHALLAPAKQEAPDLIYPTEPIGYQRICFFTLKNSKWYYTGIKSLKGLRIGTLHSVSLEEVSNYAEKHPEQFFPLFDNDSYLALRLKMLENNRLDTFITSEALFVYEASKIPRMNRMKQAGCLTPAPVYMAFTANKTHADLVQKAISLFETKIQHLKTDGRISAITAKYAMPDWSKF